MEEVFRMYAMSDGDGNGEPEELDPDHEHDFEEDDEVETSSVLTSSDDDEGEAEIPEPAPSRPGRLRKRLRPGRLRRLRLRPRWPHRLRPRRPPRRLPRRRRQRKRLWPRRPRRSPPQRRAALAPRAERPQPRRPRPKRAQANPSNEVNSWQSRRQQRRRPPRRQQRRRLLQRRHRRRRQRRRRLLRRRQRSRIGTKHDKASKRARYGGLFCARRAGTTLPIRQLTVPRSGSWSVLSNCVDRKIATLSRTKKRKGRARKSTANENVSNLMNSYKESRVPVRWILLRGLFESSLPFAPSNQRRFPS